MLSVQTIQLLISGAVIGGVLGFLGAIPYLKKKGINVEQGVTTVNNFIKEADPVINALEKEFPNNPGIAVLKVAEKWGTIGAGCAEQLCHSNNISKEKRAEKAEEVAIAALKELNIEIDDNKKIIIDAAIKNIIREFGHTEPTEAEKEKVKQDLQDKLLETQKEKEELEQKLIQVQNTVAPK